ncbi:MAG TPA: acetylxylan esterase [Vicinamibacteria bacterium]|nr:acetylxylan esterase [Vicinamibacteria bacterium]
MNPRAFFALLCAATVVGSHAAAQTLDVIYDEAKVPKYSLPDPLVMNNGERVRDANTWTSRRRPEILEIYRTEMYGRSPERPAQLAFDVSSIEKRALGGRAVRKQVTISVEAGTAAPKMKALIYLPTSAQKPVPLFLALSFAGNETVSADPGIILGDRWVRDAVTNEMVKQRAPEASRGSSAQQWQLDQILAHGYGLATIFYGDIEPDFVGGLKYGVRSVFLQPGQTEPASADWGAIAAWSWGLSRAMDFIVTDHDIDATRVAVMGHSRLGKAALWAGAQDTRFSIVISNESGEGGAAISRRLYGERTKDLNTRFPHWFDGNFKKYSEHEDQMPFDSHMLLALIAPRALYVASAEEDRWSDPRGEFLGAVNAGPVYELLGERAISADAMPGLHQPVGHTVMYHLRAGKHDVTAYDWEQYLKFADMQWGRKPD